MTTHAGLTLDERTETILEQRRHGSIRRGALVRRALLAADVVGFVVAGLIAELVFWHQGGVDDFGVVAESALLAAFLPGWIVLAKLYGLYERDDARTDHSTADDFARVFHLVSVSSWLLVGICYFTNVADPPLSKVFAFWAAAVVIIPLSRGAARTFCRQKDAYLQNTVIVGSGPTAQLVARKISNHPEYGVNLLGLVHTDGASGRAESAAGGLPYIGDFEDLLDSIQLLDVERAILVTPAEERADVIALVRSLAERYVQVDIVPSLWEILPPQSGVGFHAIEGLPLWGLPPARLSRSSLLLKRGLDIFVSVVALTVLAPLLALVALAIVVDSGRPIFFRQTRVGRSDERFRIWKFRTMTADADERKHELAHLNKHRDVDPRMFKIDDDPRTTRVGRFLRRYSLDELPQLLNVLRGQMSLVGPRPLIVDESVHVRNWATRRLHLRPGITGLWQVLGRDDITFADMIRLDYHYVSTWSLANDLWIIIRTFPAVVRSFARQ